MPNTNLSRQEINRDNQRWFEDIDRQRNITPDTSMRMGVIVRIAAGIAIAATLIGLVGNEIKDRLDKVELPRVTEEIENHGPIENFGDLFQ